MVENAFITKPNVHPSPNEDSLEYAIDRVKASPYLAKTNAIRERIQRARKQLTHVDVDISARITDYSEFIDFEGLKDLRIERSPLTLTPKKKRKRVRRSITPGQFSPSISAKSR
jgi:hypothetical protein